MSYSEQLRKEIHKLPDGGVITVDMFPANWPRNAVTRALSRLAKDGSILRLKKGVYSKVKKTRFGNVTSTLIEILAKEIEDDDNKCFGGLFLFNNLGLTTQVPSVIEILNNKSSYTSRLNGTIVRYVRIRPKINERTKRFIDLLEVLKHSKSISDSNAKATLDWIFKAVDSFEDKSLKNLVQIALDYQPVVRALLGNILEARKKIALSKELKKTLNPNSSYRVGQVALLLENINAWRLKVEATRK